MKKLLGIGSTLLLSVNLMAQATASPSKYFIVQNIASERTRVYEKCDTSANANCAHRLVFETEMIVGQKKMPTDAGVYKIANWVKFYQDTNGYYPSWYDSSYPATPEPGSGFVKWFNKKHMPTSKGEMRGAFGWYAATVYPSKTGQWMHGTIGWGSDGDRFINKAKSSFASLFVDLRSHGCTRHENRAIAYLQSLLPAETTLIKVYAKEDLADKTLSRYESQKEIKRFDYILTKEQVRSKNPFTSEASAVQKRLDAGKISNSDVLEKGSYEVDQYPNAVSLNNKRARSGQSGDAYDIGGNNMQGVFLVDEGRFVNYAHPAKIDIDGMSSFLNRSNPLPDYAVKK